MELITILATVILLATLLTLFFSFAAYFVTRAKKFRQGEMNRKVTDNSADERPVESVKPKTPSERGKELFERYTPGRKHEAGQESKRQTFESEDDQWK